MQAHSRPIHFVDTTLRDGNASLWAGAMRTDMILPIVGQLDRAGFQAMEIVATAFFKKTVRELREDPWERIRRVSALAPNTPLRAIMGRTAAAFEFTPPSVSALYMERLMANGVREVRISDSSNTVAVWQRRVGEAKKAGLRTVLNLVFSLSPVHTDEYYSALTREAVRLRVDRICLKDPGGLLTPDRTKVLAPIVVREANGVPVEFHTHCNTGLGPLCALEAIKAGIDIINTAIPPLANASSNPSVLNVADNARALGYSPVVDLDAVRQVSEHFFEVAKRENLPIGIPLEYTETHYMHQVPGGMIANLRHQLKQINMLHRLPEILEETVRVRKDMGYPIMVTPYSQFVGVQATMNVLAGERYKNVSDQVIQYALGLWGQAERDAMDPDVRDKIVSSPRARELAGWQPPEPSIQEVRNQLGGNDIDDDELLLRYLAGTEAVATMRAAPPPSEHALDGNMSFMTLVTELAKKTNLSRIDVRHNALSFSLASNEPTEA